MDIGNGNGYPQASLSNFSPHPFEFDGVLCNSMEGFLQSLKYDNVEMQKHVCTLVGKKAKFKGKKKAWYRKQELYWNGETFKRDSKEYQDLLDRAYETITRQNEGFRKALIATGNATLTHSIGKSDTSKTILTVREFCSKLNKMRVLAREIEKSKI